MDTRYNLNRLSYFVAIVEEKTMTAAAERLGLSKAVVSKQLQLLEEELGVNLLVRNTRHVRPSQMGEDFYLRSKEVLIQANKAFESVQESGKEPTGRIRLTAPVDYGVARVSPFVARFSEQYPQIKIELVLTDEQIDIVDQRFDLAFRIGWLKDSSNLARKIGDFREVAVCSKKTSTRRSIKKPEDIASIPYVAYRGMNEKKVLFSNQAKQRSVHVDSSITVNVTSAIREAIMAGDYFAILPNFTVEKDLTAKRLVELLPNWKLRKGGIYILSPPSRLRTQAIRLFLDGVDKDL